MTNQGRRPPAFFVGDHLALDFVNTRAQPDAAWTEWLGDGRDLIDWLAQAGAIEPDIAGRFRSDATVDPVAGQARELRAWLRAFVERHAGQELDEDAMPELAPLNRILAQEDGYCRVEARGGDDAPKGRQHRLRVRRMQRWTSPEQLLQPIAAAIADLVCHADFRLIRACDGSACTLMFLDRTKAHARRWCSMAVCGNRAKAAAFRARASGRRR